jgi:3-deoxy-7-phosphoheptulonate synthase
MMRGSEIGERSTARLRVVEALPHPEALRRELPTPARAAATAQSGRRAIRDVLHGRDDGRLVAIVGPCSIHDAAEALEYAGRLRQLAQSLAGELVVVMRTFVEKPRTSLGWKGLANDPGLDGSCDLARGLRASRAVLRDVNALGVPCAAEILEPTLPAYLGDLLAWGGIGARTVESQVHRQLASGAPFPIGFKNATDGSLDAACHALRAVVRPQRFPGIGPDGRAAVLESAGNPDAHLVLRGGNHGPNHDSAHVAVAAVEAAEVGVARPIVIDCSHGNSGGHVRRQAVVLREVLDQVREGRREISGVMLESQLEEGRQPLEARRRLARGVSITDACIGWNETADLLCETAEAVKLAGSCPRVR